MTTLITGATGFIGRKVHELLPKADTISRKNIDNKHQHIVTDINQYTNWSNILSGIETVIHLAGKAHDKLASESEFRNDYLASLHLAQSAGELGVKRLVYISSIVASQFDDTLGSCTSNFYGYYKHKSEVDLKKICKNLNLDLVIIRPVLVYGNEAPGNMLSLFKFVRASRFTPFGFIDNKMDFVSVDNLADFIVTCAVHDKAPGNTFNVTDDDTVSIRGFIDSIAEGMGKKVIHLPVPIYFMRLIGCFISKEKMVDQLVGDCVVDISNAKKILHWKPLLRRKQTMKFLQKGE